MMMSHSAEPRRASYDRLAMGPPPYDSAEAFLKSDHISDADCLITDVQMPGMTGIELQDRLIAQGHSLPVIFITAFPEMRARAQALAAGAVGFWPSRSMTTTSYRAFTRHWRAAPKQSVFDVLSRPDDSRGRLARF